MGPCSLRRRLPALVLLGGLVLLPAAARALPVHPGQEGPAAVRVQVRGVLEWLGQVFSSAWAGESPDNGMMIDPNGQPTSNTEGDNGMLIDPDG
ncbi:MAG TPA: hypothetical protein VN493_30040 [Thermoanaerobaculia bacterium]|nr:hypothetical protein [Thermoanaerobaculia bacterium]